MKLETFQQLPTAEVARLVREAGPKTCVFPINGTRRWFLLEHPETAQEDFFETYMRVTWERQIELYKLFFDHGVDTLLTPVVGPDILARDGGYQQLIEPGLLWFTQDRALLEFYAEYQVQARVYGDSRRWLADTPYAHTLDAFDELATRTADHRRFRLFFGVCAHDPTETVAEIGIRFYQAHGRAPSRAEIVEAYYGEPVDPVDFFIGFDRLSAFDMPLIATGTEDLYFTIAPSPYLDQEMLRAILYDHLYARRVSEQYQALHAETWRTMGKFYALNRTHILGLGRQHASQSFWYPIPQITLPPELAQEETS
jgi:tuberculosinol/isotuberculosinol synthase